ncbi:MAG TPA: hypothetical protein VGE74_17730, partial [Gemmata sp.]
MPAPPKKKTSCCAPHADDKHAPTLPKKTSCCKPEQVAAPVPVAKTCDLAPKTVMAPGGTCKCDKPSKA